MQRIYEKTFGIITALILTSQVGCADPSAFEEGSEAFETDISNPRPVSDISDYLQAARFAVTSNYLADEVAQGFKEGDEVYYAISYGASGSEAGQGRGVLVRGEGGGLFYKQTGNPTTQLALAPGLPFNNGSNGISRWEFKEYERLINQVTFAGQNYGESASAHRQKEIYSNMGARIVDFRGGTAERSANYSDVLEVKLSSKNPDRSTTNVSVYYAKGIGPISLEFRETGSVGGTFKVYINRKGSQRGAGSSY